LATRVRFSIPEREIENSGVTFKRIVNGERRGFLTIRQNHLEWKPKNGKFIFRVKWDDFAVFAKEKGKHLRPKTTAVTSKKRLQPVTE
jgi:hypothetical protein